MIVILISIVIYALAFKSYVESKEEFKEEKNKTLFAFFVAFALIFSLISILLSNELLSSYFSSISNNNLLYYLNAAFVEESIKFWTTLLVYYAFFNKEKRIDLFLSILLLSCLSFVTIENIYYYLSWQAKWESTLLPSIFRSTLSAFTHLVSFFAAQSYLKHWFVYEILHQSYKLEFRKRFWLLIVIVFSIFYHSFFNIWTTHFTWLTIFITLFLSINIFLVYN